MKRLIFALSLTLVWLACFASGNPNEILLAGKWRFARDDHDKGLAEKWFSSSLNGSINLPGSMAENKLGDDITLKTQWTGSIYDSSYYFNPRLAKYRQPGNIRIPFWLTPAKHYVGAAWYQKEVSIPADWAGKRVVLYLERPHTETRVWVDGKETGMQNSLVAPHEYDLGPFLAPGKHLVSIRIDNRIKEVNVGADSHSVSDHTQGNWNGMIGKIALSATPLVYLSDVQVYPNLAKKSARVRVTLTNSGAADFQGTVSLSAKSFNTSQSVAVPAVSATVTVGKGAVNTAEIDLPIGDNVQLWDEFNPALYRLTAVVDKGGSFEHSVNLQFGMRTFRIEGNRFLVNGRPVFLRGTVNCCEFPLTGYPNMDEAGWVRIFKAAKAHGLNHMRFHSWCPPEAAFIAADKVGFYLMPEGPSWPNHGPSIGRGQPIDKYLYEETERMAHYYGNYASYTMLSAGNEPAGNQVPYLNAFVAYWKKKDERRVYTGMSVGGSWPVVPDAEFQVRGGVRGLTWDKTPETVSDYRAGIEKFTMPFVAHEMGQWCVFPDFSEIKKYTGVYRAKNFELFKEDLGDRGMGAQWKDFHLASGKLQLLCYKNEIEKALRTPGYGGFELLGLEDFPGQGTALVGTVNVFWEDKMYTSAKLFSRFCNSTVPLARIPKFVFEASETFEAGIDLFHSGSVPLKDAVLNWTVKDASGKVFASGSFAPQTFANGNGIPAGKIQVPLSAIAIPTKLNLEVRVAHTEFVNDWDFWVYPGLPVENGDVHYTKKLDEKARAVLQNGGKVFLNAAGSVIKGKEVVMHFVPVFWNTSWFKMRPPHVTGMLIDSKSAAFNNFPTSFHSDLQWWDIANRSQVMILEDFPAGFKPLVQPIDTWFLNRRLGLVYEAKVGRGKIIVSSADLGPDVANRPSSAQLFRSLMHYMNSPGFNPKTELSTELINDVFVKPAREAFSTFTNDSPDELKPNSNQNKPKQ